MMTGQAAVCPLSKVNSTGLMNPHNVTMVETVGLKLPHSSDTTTWTRVNMAKQTERADRHRMGTACSTDWTDFTRSTDVRLPQHKGEQPFSLQVCDEGHVEQLERLRWSSSSRVKSTPASVSLRSAFSRSMVDR